MAAAMLDAELMAIIRKLRDDSLTPLQRAVKDEAEKRRLGPVLTPGEQP